MVSPNWRHDDAYGIIHRTWRMVDDLNGKINKGFEAVEFVVGSLLLSVRFYAYSIYRGPAPLRHLSVIVGRYALVACIPLGIYSTKEWACG